MAGLLAWAADVVGAGAGEHADDTRFVFTPEQQKYAWELDRKASSLQRTIEDLRGRIPSPDISKSFPHLHAHSLASNAALALQLNSHSTTKQQAQLREETLKEENAAYEKALSACQEKIQEKLQEADVLQKRLQDMDLVEKELMEKVKELQSTTQHDHFGVLKHNSDDSMMTSDYGESSKSILVKKVDEKEKELVYMEGIIQSLESQWTQVQQESIKKPSPAKREKILENQLYSLIEQLTTKQGQAEKLASEIREKNLELEKLDGLRRGYESAAEANNTRNRFSKSISGLSIASAYSSAETHGRHLNAGKTENQQKFMMLRSAFVLYILALHVIVFIRISF